MARILVYNPNANLARSLCDSVRAAGHEPVASSDGYGAVGAAEEGGCEAAVLGFELGDGASIELMGRLRAGALGAAFPVVFICGCSRYEAEQLLGGAPRVELLEKPFDSDQLGQALAAVLG